MRARDNQHPPEAALPSVFAAAHELKAPLILLRQLSFQLQSAAAKPAETAQTAERMRLTVERSLRLVDQLTRASRLDNVLFDLEPLQAQSICKDVALELSPLLKSLDQGMQVKVPRKSLLFVGQPDILRTVLVGLCDNALTYNPKGEQIVLSAHGRTNGVEFSIRDRGPTLTLGAFKQLHERLGKGPQPLSDRPQSSGLGLWVADQFARAMNGSLSVVRHHQAGLTFTLTLPYSDQLSLL